MIKSIASFKYIIGTCFFVCLIFAGNACQTDTNTSKKNRNALKKVQKKQDKSVPSYWRTARKKIPLNKEQESKLKAISKKYKNKTNELKKQKKWDDKQKVQLEKQKNKEMEAVLGADLYKKFEGFDKNWGKKKKPAPSPYWKAARKEIPLTDKEVNKIQTISQKYKTKINNLKKQKKWNDEEKAEIEKQKNKEIKTLLNKKYDKYTDFNKNWQKRKK